MKFWNASLEARLMTIFAGEFRLERRPFRVWLILAIAGGLIAAAALLGWRFRDRFSSILPPEGTGNNKEG